MKIAINGETRVVDAAMTLSELMVHLDVKPQHVAVEVNTELIPREEHCHYRLAEGDQLEIVTLVGGG